MAGMLAVVAVSASEEGIKSLAGSAPQPLRWEVCIGEDSTVDVPMAEVATSEEDSASAASGSFSVGDGKVDAASCRGGGRFLFVRDAHRQRLSVRLVDAKGVAVGWGTCPLDDVSADGDLHGAEVVVAGDDLDLGVPVRLQLRYTPFSEALAAAPCISGDLDPSGVLAAPGPALMSDAWRSLCDAVMEASDAAFDPVAFVDNEATDTQVWLFWSRARRQVVVAFRGTEQSSWKDILTDISLTPVALHTQRMADSPRSIPLAELSAEPGPVTRMLNSVERAKEEAAIVRRKKEEQVKAEAASSSEEESEKKEGNGHVLEGTAEVVSAAVEAVSTVASELQEVLSRVKRIIDEGEASAAALPATEAWVHSGFLGAYDSVRSAVLGLVDATLAGEDTSQWSVVLTGHSLGGALATLCAHDLAHRTWSAPPRLVMYNYGSPRLGNKVFAAEFNRAVPNAWRVVNNNDAVVTVPRLMGYCHVGHAVILGAGGAMEIQRDTSEAPFEGVAVPEVLPAVGAVITAAVSSAVPAIMEAAGREIALATRSSSDEDGGEAGEVGSGTNVLAQQKEEAAAAESGLGADQLSVLWEQEKAAWTTLLQGQSMSEHMEDFYFEAINQAVKEWKARAANEQMEGKQNGAAAESKGGRIGASDGEENEQHMVQHTEETRE